MREELELKFRDRWPVWFRHMYGPVNVTCLHWGFQCGDGWFQIVWDLCERVEPIVNAGEAETRSDDGEQGVPFEVYQVKEKFGGLRFYENSRSGRINALVNDATRRSFHTCDICGKRGTLGPCPAGVGTRCGLHIKEPEPNWMLGKHRYGS